MWGIFNILSQRLARKSRNEILALYGDPGQSYEQRYCVSVNIKAQFNWFPYASEVLINKDFWGELARAFSDLETAGLQGEIKTYDGCLVIRNTRGSNLISLHAWGMAMDLNASTEQLGQKTTGFSDQFIEIMRRYVYWGGDFISRKDPMHFSLYGE